MSRDSASANGKQVAVRRSEGKVEQGATAGTQLEDRIAISGKLNSGESLTLHQVVSDRAVLSRVRMAILNDSRTTSRTRQFSKTAKGLPELSAGLRGEVEKVDALILAVQSQLVAPQDRGVFIEVPPPLDGSALEQDLSDLLVTAEIPEPELAVLVANENVGRSWLLGKPQIIDFEGKLQVVEQVPAGGFPDAIVLLIIAGDNQFSPTGELGIVNKPRVFEDRRLLHRKTAVGQRIDEPDGGGLVAGIGPEGASEVRQSG